MGRTIGVIKEDTWSLDYSSFGHYSYGLVGFSPLGVEFLFCCSYQNLPVPREAHRLLEEIMLRV